MRLANVTGTVTATVKSQSLTGLKFLLVDYTDAGGKVIDAARVVADDVGAGVGDQVIVSEGSAARLPNGMAGLAVDATVLAIVDEVKTKARRAAAKSG